MGHIWSKEKVRAMILELHRAKGTIYREQNVKLYKAAVYYFGSWEKAVKSAGIRLTDAFKKRGPARRQTKEKIIKQIGGLKYEQ